MNVGVGREGVGEGGGGGRRKIGKGGRLASDIHGTRCWKLQGHEKLASLLLLELRLLREIPNCVSVRVNSVCGENGPALPGALAYITFRLQPLLA